MTSIRQENTPVVNPSLCRSVLTIARRLAWFLSCLVFLGGPVHGQTVVRPVQLSKANQDIVLVRFFAGEHLDTKAKGVAVTDPANQPVAYRLLAHDPQGATVIAINLAETRGPVELRYSTQPATAAKIDPDLHISLLLRTFTFGGSSPSPKQLLGAMERVKPQGAALVSQISFAHNPFGPDQHFVSDFQGLLKIDEPDTFRLFSVHDDAAFVYINGEQVIDEAKPHVIRSSDELGRRAKAIELSQGVHHVRYVHLQKAQRSMAMLGLMYGQRAAPIPPHMFVHHEEVTLGAARFDPANSNNQIPVGFDVQQRSQRAHASYNYTLLHLSPIAEAPEETLYHWRFGDGTTGQSTGREPIDHVYVSSPQPANDRWRITLEWRQKSSGATEATKHQATSMVRSVRFADINPITSGNQLFVYANAIGQAKYEQADPKLMKALYTLVRLTEQPSLIAPLAEPFVRRFGDQSGSLVSNMKYLLATHLAQDDPKRAVDLFGQVARNRDYGKDTWKNTCAAAEQLDLLIFRIGQTQDLLNFIRPLLSGLSAREIALLKSKLGDAHRVAGDFEMAAQRYREAKQIANRQLDVRRAAVLESTYRETALGYLKQQRYPALRDVLFQWEADFPTAKLGGDLPLLVGRYYQAVGDDERAIIEYQSLLKLNPRHPSRPELTYRLAESLKRLGRFDEARLLFQQVVNEYPNSPFADQAAKES